QLISSLRPGTLEVAATHKGRALMTRKTKPSPAAVHEAAHVVVGLEHGWLLDCVGIRKKHEGFVIWRCEDDWAPQMAPLDQQIDVDVAGYLVESLPDFDDGDRSRSPLIINGKEFASHKEFLKVSNLISTRSFENLLGHARETEHERAAHKAWQAVLVA